MFSPANELTRAKVVTKENQELNDEKDALIFENDLGLNGEIWRLIFCRLPIGDLIKAGVVCKAWYKHIHEPSLLAQSFALKWNLLAVEGVPSNSLFWIRKLSEFAISHPLSKHDTVVSLAVKYNSQVMEIKRLNNMISDHAIHSRGRILIPVHSPQQLLGKKCYIEMDGHANREVAVVYLDGHEPASTNHVSSFKDDSVVNRQNRLIGLLKNSLGVDDSTAIYYFKQCNGDIRKARKLFMADLYWEQKQTKNENI